MSSKHPLHVAVVLALAMASHASNAHAQSSSATSPDGSADATTLDRIEVRPQLEQQMRAIDFKRGADAIQDTVSSDAMGQYRTRTLASRYRACRVSARPATRAKAASSSCVAWMPPSTASVWTASPSARRKTPAAPRRWTSFPPIPPSA
jgi:hypothetical protein